jgi:hypothetical protein
MEETAKQETKTKPCWCTALIGASVIAIVWFEPEWGGIALKTLGVVLILRGLIGKCCCSLVCKPKA